jgi:hypothetical protein
MAAGLEGKDDVVTAQDAFHRFPDTLHDAGALMAQDHRPIRLFVPVIDVADIGVADAAGDDAHQHFIVPRALHLEEFTLQGAAPLTQNGCMNPLHVRIG